MRTCRGGWVRLSGGAWINMGARTYGLIQAIHAPDRGDAALAEVFARYGGELLE